MNNKLHRSLCKELSSSYLRTKDEPRVKRPTNTNTQESAIHAPRWVWDVSHGIIQSGSRAVVVFQHKLQQSDCEFWGSWVKRYMWMMGTYVGLRVGRVLNQESTISQVANAVGWYWRAYRLYTPSLFGGCRETRDKVRWEFWMEPVLHDNKPTSRLRVGFITVGGRIIACVLHKLEEVFFSWVWFRVES